MILDFLSSLAWAAVVLLIAEKAHMVARQWITAQLDIARAKVPEAKKGPLPARSDIQLPDDLEAYVNDWNDEWAKDDNRNYLRIKYLELHTGNADETWQRVRRAVGIGELP